MSRRETRRLLQQMATPPPLPPTAAELHWELAQEQAWQAQRAVDEAANDPTTTDDAKERRREDYMAAKKHKHGPTTRQQWREKDREKRMTQEEANLAAVAAGLPLPYPKKVSGKVKDAANAAAAAAGQPEPYPKKPRAKSAAKEAPVSPPAKALEEALTNFTPMEEAQQIVARANGHAGSPILNADGVPFDIPTVQAAPANVNPTRFWNLQTGEQLDLPPVPQELVDTVEEPITVDLPVEERPLILRDTVVEEPKPTAEAPKKDAPDLGKVAHGIVKHSLGTAFLCGMAWGEYGWLRGVADYLVGADLGMAATIGILCGELYAGHCAWDRIRKHGFKDCFGVSMLLIVALFATAAGMMADVREKAANTRHTIESFQQGQQMAAQATASHVQINDCKPESMPIEVTQMIAARQKQWQAGATARYQSCVEAQQKREDAQAAREDAKQASATATMTKVATDHSIFEEPILIVLAIALSMMLGVGAGEPEQLASALMALPGAWRRRKQS